MFTLRIDGTPVNELSLDQLGATLQQIAVELASRGYKDEAELTHTAGNCLRGQFKQLGA